jgi:hypothetical protein
MSKVNISIHNDIKVVELDTDKQYAIIFPDYTTMEDFQSVSNKIKEIGVEKFISVHKASDTKFKQIEVE